MVSQPGAACGSQRSSSRSTAGRMPRPIRTMQRRRCARYTPTSSRHNGDTIDLLERRLAAPYQIESDAADQAHAAFLRQLLQLTHRRAIDDRLAQLIVEHQELTDRLAAAIS